MDPIPLNTVRATVADVAADTSGTAVAAPVAGAAADARAIFAGATADTAVAAGDIAAAAADSAGEHYRCACRVRRHYGLHVRPPLRPL